MLLIGFTFFKLANPLYGQSTSKEEFKPSGKVWEYAFKDFFDKVGGDIATWVSRADYSPHKNVHIMPNIWYNSYKAKAESALLVDREADIVPRMTFYFIFR